MKRLFDITGALFLILMLLPLLTIIMVAIALKLGRPIFFKQLRPGLHGRPFLLYKFRTMTDCKDGNGRLLPDDARITPFGRWLRKYSLDELPQLLNVIKGELSFVGPRPLLMEYLPLYSKEQARRNEVRPGITGWAQVNGRNSLNWDEKFALDVWYVDNWSLWLDIKIILLTITTIIRPRDINHEGFSTMPRFKG